MAVRWDSKILLGKIETAYGTDAAPTGADNAILATNVTFQPMEGQDVSRELELPWLAAQATIPAGLHSRISFRVEMVPSGTAGVAPAWGPLVRACRCGQLVVPDTSVAYNGVTDNHESITIHFWVGPTRFVLRGTRGDCTMRFNAQGIAYLEFSFTGFFALPADAARPTPTLSAFLDPELVSHANTPTFAIGGTSLVMRSFALALGNSVQVRLLVGEEKIWIESAAELVTCQIEATPLATFDPFARAADPAARAEIELVHGTGAGRIATLNIPSAQMQRPAGYEAQQNVAEWPLRLTPLPVAGNDQWTLTLT